MIVPGREMILTDKPFIHQKSLVRPEGILRNHFDKVHKSINSETLVDTSIGVEHADSYLYLYSVYQLIVLLAECGNSLGFKGKCGTN